MILRWGIASAGKISNDFVNALQVYPESSHKVVAVAAKALDRAQEFANKFKIPKAYEGYQALATDPEIDIVYVGSLIPQHYEISKLMLENGKHVLCEKAFTINQKQAKKLIDLAREKKLFIREAIWSRNFPAYEELQKQIKSGTIGDVKFVQVDFGFPLDDVERLSVKQLGGSCVLDLGIYALQFQQFVFRGLKPTKFICAGHLNKFETDESFSAVFTYSQGRTAVVSASAKLPMPNEAVIVGTKGIIRVPDFWCPVKIITPSQKFEYQLTERPHPFNFHHSAGLCYQAEDARQCIQAGKIESDYLTHEETLELAGYMDIIRREVGNIFPEDAEK